jgi:chromosome segregation protein
MLHQKEIALTNLVKELEKKSIEKEEIEHEINLLNEKYNGIKVEIENRLTLIESREKNIAVDEEYINKKKRELEKELEQIKSDREQLIRQEESLAEIKQGAIALMRYGEVHEKKHNEMILKEIESKQHNLEEQIKGFNELMNEKEKELSLREHRLQEDMSAIKEKELSLSEKEMWINKQEETYLTDKEKVMEVWSKLKGVLDEIDNREKMIEMKISETFKDRNSENQKKKEEIEKQLVLLKEQENKLSLKEASLENKSNELIQREVLLYKREHDLMEYEKELKKRSEKLDSIKMKLVNNMSAPDEK